MNANDSAMVAALAQAVGADLVGKTFPADVPMHAYIALRGAGFVPVAPAEPKESPDADGTV